MGIRINKRIGYAINGLDYNKEDCCLTDKRINPLGYLGRETDHEDREETWTVDGYLKFCKSRMNRWEFSLLQLGNERTKSRSEIYDLIECDQEFDMPDVIMLSVLGYNDWHRHDDIIDYVEHNQVHRGAINTITFLDSAIWPYEGYIDSETGEELGMRNGNVTNEKYQLVKEMWFSYRSAQFKNQKEKNRKLHEELANSYASRMGMSLEEALERYTPYIPTPIVLLAKYLCLFEDESTIWKLRPAIYTYWR